MASLQQIISWFREGLFPTENQFKDAWTSFWHKSEKIPLQQVFGLKETLEASSKGLIYQDPVGSKATLATAYPNPLPGWASLVQDEGLIYSWNGNNWANTGLEAFPADVALKGGSTKTLKEVETEIVQLAGDIKENVDNSIGEDLVSFQDKNHKQFGSVKPSGAWDIELTEERKKEIDPTIEIQGDDLFGLMDKDGKYIPIIDKNGEVISEINLNFASDYEKERGELEVETFKPVELKISLPSIAVGRESTAGANDAPVIPLTTGGYTHPSVAYIPSGWCGWCYWMAITPTFGITEQHPQSATSSFENPHILVSNDGVNWQEPVGISNPIDLPPAADTPIHANGYWSDTHIELGADGYMYVYYRGNNMSPDKLNIQSGTPLRAVVCRKSRDGVNWSEAKLLYSTDSVGVDSNSMIASPAFINEGCIQSVYDVVENTVTNQYSAKNQTSRIIMRRFSTDGSNFENYSQQNVVNLNNKPWENDEGVWHLDAHKRGNTYFLLLNVGKLSEHLADKLYLAYSGDGWNFQVVETALTISNSYRSAIVPKSDTGLKFYVFESNRIDGSLNLYELILKYK